MSGVRKDVKTGICDHFFFRYWNTPFAWSTESHKNRRSFYWFWQPSLATSSEYRDIFKSTNSTKKPRRSTYRSIYIRFWKDHSSWKSSTVGDFTLLQTNHPYSNCSDNMCSRTCLSIWPALFKFPDFGNLFLWFLINHVARSLEAKIVIFSRAQRSKKKLWGILRVQVLKGVYPCHNKLS